MPNRFSRTEMLFGKSAMDSLASSRVAVFGIGGVGGYAAEALVRSGIGAIDLIDNDTVSITNLNRQIFALTETVGMYKTDAAEERLIRINPELRVYKHRMFFTPENSSEINFGIYDYVVDAIDTVTGKLEIIKRATEANVPVISSMGTGNKTNPAALEVADIYKTSVCPLARVMRHELKKAGIKNLKTVYSKEEPIVPLKSKEEIPQGRRQVPGSTSFVPPAAGLIIASEVIKDIISFKSGDKL